MIDAYPLCWPLAQQRSRKRERSRFDVTFAKARDGILREIEMLGGRNPVISTNVPLKRDGFPYAGQKEPEDSGVAVYFDLDSKPQCFACDRWDSVKDNMQAVRHTIAALRGIERWGTAGMMKAAFTGFAALPEKSSCGAPNYFEDCLTNDDRKSRYRELCLKFHPDIGGNGEEFLEMKRQYEMSVEGEGK